MVKNFKKTKLLLILILLAFVVVSFAITLKTTFAEETTKPSDVIVAETGISGFEDNIEIGSEEGSVDYKGLFVKTNSSNVKISYNKTIDAKSLSKDDALIELQFLGMGSQGYAKAKTAALYLTDATNPSNRIGVGFYPTNDLGEAKNGGDTYFRVIYNGQSVSYDNGRNRHWINNFGLCAYGRSLYPGKFGVGAGKVPTLIRFDYAEKAFYLDNQNGTTMILDLDLPLHVGEGALWDGFNQDKCILTFEVEYEDTKNGGFVIGKLLGRDFGVSSFDLSKNKPSANIVVPYGSTADSLPKAEVGTSYRIPELDVFDFIYEADTVVSEVKAYRGTTDVSSEISNGYLTPTVSGELKLVYKATNLDGNSSTFETVVNVVQNLAPFTYSKSHNRYPIIGEYFDVPEIFVQGGSGLLEVEEIAMYNGRELDFTNSRKILINEAGSITISISVKGYTGELEKSLFVYSVSLDKASIVVESMPFSVATGKALIIPDFKVIGSNGEEIDKKVYVGTTDITSTMSYDVSEEKGSVLAVRFCGGEGDFYNEVIYNVVVVSDTYKLSDYINITNGEATIVDSHEDDAVVLTAQQDITAQFAFPVSLYNLDINYDFDGSLVNSLDVVLTGYENRSDSLFFRIAYLTADSSSLTINGQGEKFVLPVSFDRLSAYEFNIQSKEGELYFANTLIANFEPMVCSGAIVSLKLNGVKGESDIYIKKLSNQSFNPKAYIMGDNVSAYVYINGEVEKYRQVTSVNANILLPSAKAYDVLSDGATVSLSVTAPSKEKIYEGSIDTPCKIPVSEYGMYIISYIVKDSKGNTANFNYNIELIDRIKPSITVKNRPDELYAVGDVLELSEVSVSDNHDKEPVIEIFIKNNTTGEVGLISENYTFKKKGKYTLTYKVRDAAYNYASIEYQIEVVE